MTVLRVLELYSGIGGMHYALEDSGIEFEVVGAVDINTTANEIYLHNFPETNLLQRCIESISVKEMNKLNFDMILMSPPCQPFTRVGLQKDASDPRTKSFFHLMEVLPKLSRMPNYILVENVKGFECSQTRLALIEMLQKCDYSYQEYLISPVQFGVPNSRLRYYLLAKKKPLGFVFTAQDKITTELPECCHPLLKHIKTEVDSDLRKDSTVSENTVISDGITQKDSDEENVITECNPDSLCSRFNRYCESLANYLEDIPEEDIEKYLIPEKELTRFGVMDICKRYSTRSCCFTKRYGHYMEGAGSVLQMAADEEVASLLFKEGMNPEIAKECMNDIKKLKLRYFTPREIANLMCFPAKFNFPSHFSTIQQYRVLGNSLNVHVVAVLINVMLLEPTKQEDETSQH